MLGKDDKFSELRLAALALAAIYFAVMSGHMHSIDGLLIYRQAESFSFEHSIFFSKPLWPDAPWLSSKYGIGLSLLYVPGLWVASWFQPYVPIYGAKLYDPILYYTDPYYAWVAAPVHALITALAAYLVGLFCKELGLSKAVCLWGMALYGLGSPAFIYARGDWSQQLEGLCWIAALYGALRFHHNFRSGAALCSVALCYGLLTRPVEGVLLVPVAALMAIPDIRPRRWSPARWRGLTLIGAGVCAGVAVTLLVNWTRYGSPSNFGYENESWSTPLWLGLPGTLVSPARGLIWEFPAVVCSVLGVKWLSATQHRNIGLLLAALSLAQLLNVAAWMWWWGGGNFGLRLFVPALPLLSVLAAARLSGVSEQKRNRVALGLLAGGLLFSLPCVLTDLAGGYGMYFDSPVASLRLDGYPLVSAFRYLQHIVATSPTDMNGIDILWVRLAGQTGGLSLLPMLLFIGIAVALARRILAAQGVTLRVLMGTKAVSKSAAVGLIEDLNHR